MKKIIALILTTAVSLFAFAGCSSTVEYEKYSYWLSKELNDLKTVGHIDETLTYEVKSTAGLSTDLKANLTGVYTVTTKDVDAKEHGFSNIDGKIYMLETKLNITGNYTAVAVNESVNDEITTKVYFKGLGENLTPLFSSRSVKCISPTADDGFYKFLALDYSFTITYSSGKATAEFTYNDEKTQTAFKNHDKKFTRSYSKSSFIDNEAILFYLRAFNVNTKAFSYSFKTFDAVSQLMTPMVCNLVTSSPHDKLNLTFTENGQVRQNREIVTDHLELAIQGDFSGAPIYLWYANNSNVNNYYHRLFKMQSSLPYNIGNLVYTLTEINYA